MKLPLQRCIRYFTAHPAQAGETYAQHLRFTAGVAMGLFVTALLLLIHGLLPFLFCRSGSERCARINNTLQDRKKD